jgi:hypothetical protein
MAPTVRQHPEARAKEVRSLTDQTIAHPAPQSTQRKRGQCSGCGTSSATKTLTAPRPNAEHGYRGPMYCLSCNPRFGGDMLDAQWSALERMGV